MEIVLISLFLYWMFKKNNSSKKKKEKGWFDWWTEENKKRNRYIDEYDDYMRRQNTSWN